MKYSHWLDILKYIKKKMLKLFNQNWKYVAGGGTVLAYQAWYDRIKSAEKAKEAKLEILKAISENNSKLDEILNTVKN